MKHAKCDKHYVNESDLKLLFLFTWSGYKCLNKNLTASITKHIAKANIAIAIFLKQKQRLSLDIKHCPTQNPFLPQRLLQKYNDETQNQNNTVQHSNFVEFRQYDN